MKKKILFLFVMLTMLFSASANAQNESMWGYFVVKDDGGASHIAEFIVYGNGIGCNVYIYCEDLDTACMICYAGCPQVENINLTLLDVCNNHNLYCTNQPKMYYDSLYWVGVPD